MAISAMKLGILPLTVEAVAMLLGDSEWRRRQLVSSTRAQCITASARDSPPIQLPRRLQHPLHRAVRCPEPSRSMGRLDGNRDDSEGTGADRDGAVVRFMVDGRGGAGVGLDCQDEEGEVAIGGREREVVCVKGKEEKRQLP